MSTNLIDTYVSEVGRQLPQKNRIDIEAEIHSVLQDMLDERSKQTGKPIDEELIMEVLQEYDSPEKVAASYQGERFLIGPGLYRTYIKVIQIVLPIMGVLALIGLVFSLSRPGANAITNFGTTLQTNIEFYINTIAQAVSNFFASMISALGSITLIFAILERVIPDLKTKEARWDAHTLLKISPPDRIKPAELVLEIFFSGLAIMIFNFFPKIIGFTPSLNSLVETGNWQTVTFFPFLSEAFLSYIPFLTGIWVLTIVLDVILIQRGNWEDWTRWFAVGTKVLGITIAVIMLTGPSLIAVTPASLVAAGYIASDTASILVTLMNQAIRVGLVLAILFGGLDLIKMLLRLFRGKAPIVLTSK
jgi:hypothetical protein